MFEISRQILGGGVGGGNATPLALVKESKDRATKQAVPIIRRIRSAGTASSSAVCSLAISLETVHVGYHVEKEALVLIGPDVSSCVL